MKLITHQNAKIIKNGEVCTVTDYKIDTSQAIDCAVIEIKGRYPINGRVRNHTCKELAYINEGNGIINIENKVISLAAGDAILIEPGEKYYWEGQFKLFITCVPAWYAEQHETLE